MSAVRSALDALVAEREAAEPPPSALTTIGYRVDSLDRATGEVVCSFTADETMGNLVGVVQGGFIAAMLDATVSSALMAVIDEGQTAPTLELKISYLEPVPIGPLTARGRVLRRGGSVGFVAGELHDPSGRLCATASATVRITRPR